MTDTPKVFAAIAAVAGILARQGIAKDQENSDQHYEFRGIDDVYNVLGPVLSECKLCLLPRVLSRETIEGTYKSGSKSFHTYLDVEFDFVSAEDGSIHTVRTQGEALDTSDKSVNKALIAAYKYMVFLAFCIPVKGMDDADKESPEVAETITKPKKADPAEKELPQGGDEPVTPPEPADGTIDALLEQKIGFGKHKERFWYEVLDDAELREYIHWIIGNAAKQLREDDKPIGDNAKNAARVIAHHEELKAREV